MNNPLGGVLSGAVVQDETFLISAGLFVIIIVVVLALLIVLGLPP
jgi:hypothetical protein